MIIDRQFSSDALKDEARVWDQLIAPQLNLPRNVLNICRHGFTEILNNVIDHANSHTVTIRCNHDAHNTQLDIEDDGIGVFMSLRTHFGFESDIHALIELTKGKLTTAPRAHSGEGIFFSSKMFDQFLIESSDLSVSFEPDQCSVRTIPHRRGTLVQMHIANNSSRTAQEVFNRFTDTKDFTFCKTRFFLSLAALSGELTSRSQAKRAVARFENFSEVELDFSGVDHIGQAFADELLRVWPLAHPATRITTTHANESVGKMIQHVMGRHDLPQPAKT